MICQYLNEHANQIGSLFYNRKNSNATFEILGIKLEYEAKFKPYF